MPHAHIIISCILKHKIDIYVKIVNVVLFMRTLNTHLAARTTAGFSGINIPLQELFYLLDEKDDDVPDGMVTVKSLVVELMAGGVSPEHTQYVRFITNIIVSNPENI